jgi:DNA-binding NarL/FixJ family response regulator
MALRAKLGGDRSRCSPLSRKATSTGDLAMAQDRRKRPRLPRAANTDPPNLSARQHQIARALQRGLTSKQIAAQLGLSRRTIETHRSLLYRKFGVQNAAELIATLVRLGLQDGS